MKVSVKINYCGGNIFILYEDSEYRLEDERNSSDNDGVSWSWTLKFQDPEDVVNYIMGVFETTTTDNLTLSLHVTVGAKPSPPPIEIECDNELKGEVIEKHVYRLALLVKNMRVISVGEHKLDESSEEDE